MARSDSFCIPVEESMLARSIVALTFMFAVKAQGALSCNSLLYEAERKIFQAEVVPNKARFLFILGNTEMLPVRRIDVQIFSQFIKTSLVTEKEGALAFARIELPDFAGRLQNGYRKSGFDFEVSYQDGVLTYLNRHNYVKVNHSVLFGLRETFFSEYSIVKMEISEDLSHIGKIDFTQQILDVKGEIIETNTITSGAFPATP